MEKRQKQAPFEQRARAGALSQSTEPRKPLQSEAFRVLAKGSFSSSSSCILIRSEQKKKMTGSIYKQKSVPIGIFTQFKMIP